MIKSISNRSDDLLARLAAEESITVTHNPNATTASFNLKSRILVMPVWANMTRDIRHMLTFHEIAHALYTPFDEWGAACDEHGGSIRSYCNIVEDARIERMIKNKFPGIRRDFLDGYRKLHERDLFEIDGKDLADLSIGDRINLHYKIGYVEPIPFAADEQIWIDRIDAATTFADVVDIAVDLREAMKDETPETTDEPNNDIDQPGIETPDTGEQSEDGPKGNGTMTAPSDEGGDAEGEDGIGSAGEGDEENDETADGDSNESGEGGEGGEGDEGDEEGDSGAGMEDDTDDGESAESEQVATNGAGKGSDIQTQESFDKNIQGEAGDRSSDNYLYRAIPVGKLENIVIDFTDCHKRLNHKFTQWIERDADAVNEFVRDAGSFINGSTKTVNQMAQQFEMKKRAEVDRQTKISSSGELNMEELVNYKFTEDIFLRTEETPDGKNHGLVVLIDWSGSMSNCMEETIRQMVQLVLFCKKVQIPFEVYAFTNNDFHRSSRNDRSEVSSKWELDTDGEVFDDHFQLLNLMSSRMNSLQYKSGLKHVMMLAKELGSGGWGCGIPTDFAFQLSGTPLDEAINVMNQIIPAFRSQNDLNVVNLAILTDGCSNGSRWGEVVQADGTSVYGTPILQNKKNGGQYAMGGAYCSATNALLDYTRDNTGVKIIGIFLETGKPKRVAANLCHRYDDLATRGYDAVESQFKNDGFIATTSDGYDEYFIVAAQKQVEQNHIKDLDSGATITKIKNTFLKGTKGTKTSRVMLNQMIEHLA